MLMATTTSIHMYTHVSVYTSIHTHHSIIDRRRSNNAYQAMMKALAHPSAQDSEGGRRRPISLPSSGQSHGSSCPGNTWSAHLGLQVAVSRKWGVLLVDVRRMGALPFGAYNRAHTCLKGLVVVSSDSLGSLGLDWSPFQNSCKAWSAQRNGSFRAADAAGVVRSGWMADLWHKSSCSALSGTARSCYNSVCQRLKARPLQST